MMYLPQEVLLLRFKLQKKHNGFFILKSNCLLECKGSTKIISNYVTIISPARKRYAGCDTSYFGIKKSLL